MIVVDASAAVFAFVGTDARGQRARQILSDDREWLVPEHWTVEVVSALRGLVAGRALHEDEAVRALDRLRNTRVHSVAASMLITAMWTLRHNFSAYDAPYVVIAAARDLTLVSGDGRLARGAVSHCRVELV